MFLPKPSYRDLDASRALPTDLARASLAFHALVVALIAVSRDFSEFEALIVLMSIVVDIILLIFTIFTSFLLTHQPKCRPDRKNFVQYLKMALKALKLRILGLHLEYLKSPLDQNNQYYRLILDLFHASGTYHVLIFCNEVLEPLNH